METLIAEGESTRDLAGQNIVLLYGAGEIDGQFCAAMEYIQGNSIATMLARKEGFSIWDLLDITRQVCAGLEHAAAKGVAHCSLEPGKIMVQWDGMVKILGYGISNMSLIEAESGKGLGRLMPYCSPEQIRGEAIDLRSNLFTLGTILYEMVVGRQAFDAADPVTLVSRIENEMPRQSVCGEFQDSTGGERADYEGAGERSGGALSERARTGGRPGEVQGKRQESPLRIARRRRRRMLPSVAQLVRRRPASLSPAASSHGQARAFRFSIGCSGCAQTCCSENRRAGVFGGAVRQQPKREPLLLRRAAGGSGLRLPGTDSGSDSASGSDTAPDSNSDSNSDLKSGARSISDFEVSAPESRAGSGPVLSAAAVEQESERHSPRVAC